MHAGLTFLGVLDALVFFGGIVGIMVLPGWLQTRHQEMTRRQIALTDALDAEFGPVVTPLVRKPFWGPWRIEMAVPCARPAMVARILAMTHEMLSVAERTSPVRYRIVLTAAA